MEKIKYEKPIVLDLNGNNANGAPLVCFAGSSANGTDESCTIGGTPIYTDNCSGGINVSPNCFGGSGNSIGDCLSGGSAYYCTGGSGGGTDPNGCRNGPSVG